MVLQICRVRFHLWPGIGNGHGHRLPPQCGGLGLAVVQPPPHLLELALHLVELASKFAPHPLFRLLKLCLELALERVDPRPEARSPGVNCHRCAAGDRG